MKEMMNVIQVIFAALGGWLGWFLGGWDGPLLALVIAITIDYITGLMCAIADKSLSSEIGFKGIFRKVVILMLVGVGALLDAYIIKSGEIMRTAVVFYYFSNEGISILENAAHLGLPVPDKLADVLEQLKEDRHEKG